MLILTAHALQPGLLFHEVLGDASGPVLGLVVLVPRLGALVVRAVWGEHTGLLLDRATTLSYDRGEVLSAPPRLHLAVVRAPRQRRLRSLPSLFPGLGEGQ